MNSAMSLVQGLYPANPGYNITLANGSTVTGPLGGYQVRVSCHKMSMVSLNRSVSTVHPE
jgi:hypothetical protein